MISKFVNDNSSERENEIPVYIQFFNISRMNKEAGTLEKIIKEHVTGSSTATKVEVKP